MSQWLAGFSSERTRTSYAAHLAGLVTGLDDFSGVTEAAIVEWATHPRQDGRPPANNTVRTRLNAWQGFARWLAEYGYPAPQFSTVLRRLRRSFPTTYGKKQSKNAARFLTREQADQLLNAGTGTDGDLRDEIVIRLGLVGLRRSEIAALRFSNLTPTSVRFTGKGNKPADIPLPRTTLDALAEWTRRYTAAVAFSPDLPVICPTHSHAGRPTAPMSTAVVQWGRPVTGQTIYAAVQRRASAASLGQLAPHDLRRTCASILHNARSADGAHYFDLLDIQQYLRHSDPATTMQSYLEPMSTSTVARASSFLG